MSEKGCIIQRNKKKKTKEENKRRKQKKKTKEENKRRQKKKTKGDKRRKKKHCNRLKKDTAALSHSIHLLYNSANKKSKSIPEFQKWTNIFVQF